MSEYIGRHRAEDDDALIYESLVEALTQDDEPSYSSLDECWPFSYNGDPETIPVDGIHWGQHTEQGPGPQRPTYRTGFTIYVTHEGDTVVNTRPLDIEMEPSADDIRKASWDCWSFHDAQRVAEAVIVRMAR